MATRITPPSLTKSKSYDLYKQELLAWAEVTDLKKNKRGIAIALSLPDDEEETKIREKVFEQLPLDDLKREDGLDILIQFMDMHLAKDDLTDSLEKFEIFEDFTRNEQQSIHEYIAAFDANYRKIEKKKMALPPEILAFKLLRKANITKEEKMLVLTGMNYEHRETLYEDAKRSLKKFKGDRVAEKEKSIRLEPAFLAENEEALLAAGYVRRGNPRRWNNFRGRGSNFRGNPRGAGFHPAQRGFKNMNALGPDGQTLTCRACGSYRHLLAKCPDNWENRNTARVHITEENVVLFTGNQKPDIIQLGMDARNCAVLDSACSSTVCGKSWLKSYLGSLDEEDQKKITHSEGRKLFRFGGGERLKSAGSYELPVRIVGNDVRIRTDVVDSDIPLLLSRSAMKRAGVKMDLENDTAIIMGKEVALNITSSGHYCIPIDKTETVQAQEVNAVQLDKLDIKDLKSAMLKLHRQFAHPPKNRLAALLKDANVWKDEHDEVLSDIASKCQLCQRYAKAPPRPVVSMPMAKNFNEKVAMDLKYFKGRWILHMIDMWSRYTVSVFITRKKPSNVIDALMKNWVGVFGVMEALMTDNGGEFSSEEMREISSILNIRLCTTAGMSPYQNGLCERVHAVTDMMLTKLEAENSEVELETLLSWANMARNSLQMWNGFSSNQLVFGKNPSIPNIMQAELPALDGCTSSKTFHTHLNALYDARKAYIQSEADERIRRALRSKVRASEQIFDNGDLVFYKREGKERWLGPGKVVFQDGKVVFVRHGSVFVRVSPNRLCLVNPGFDNPETEENTNLDKPKPLPKDDKPGRAESSETSIRNFQENESDIVEPCSPSPRETEPSVEAEIRDFNLKKNDKIQYRLPGEEEWLTAIILGRAGKTTGMNKTWYNVKNLTAAGELQSLDLKQIEWRSPHPEETEPIDVAEVSTELSHEKAKQAELQKLLDFGTYEEVVNCGQKTISTRWVITTKEGTTRARLVARGFEETYFITSDSPTVSKGAMRAFLTVASSRKWNIKTTDIKSAFLQGEQLDRDVYLRPPIESRTPDGLIWKLRHGLYGLKDGARQFYMSVRNELTSLGCTQLKFDPAVFIMIRDGQLFGIICSHVDDFIHAGDESFEIVIQRMRKRFLAGKIESGDFQYIGFRMMQGADGIRLDHSRYMANLGLTHIEPERALQKTDQLTVGEQKLYRRLIGQLNWAVQGSRPDLAFELVDLSTKLNAATVADFLRAIKVIGRLKQIKPVQLFPLLKGKMSEDWEIFVFTDASLGNINDGKGSVGAHILWMKDRIGNCCPIAWQAKKIKRVVRSTIAAEGLALLEGLEAAIYYRELFAAINILKPVDIPITAFIDNKSIVEALQSTKLVDDMRLRIDIAAITEMQHNNKVSVKWCPGKIQLANSLTKRGASGIELLNVLQKGKMPEEFV